MISDGSGMHADSIAIRSTTPPYPRKEIVATTKLVSMPIIFAIMFYVLVAMSPIRPAVLADQWDESATAVIFFPATPISLYHSDQSLTLTRIANGDNQAAADF